MVLYNVLMDSKVLEFAYTSSTPASLDAAQNCLVWEMMEKCNNWARAQDCQYILGRLWSDFAGYTVDSQGSKAFSGGHAILPRFSFTSIDACALSYLQPHNLYKRWKISIFL